MTDVSPVAPNAPIATGRQWLAPVAMLAVLFAMSWWGYDRLPPQIVVQTLFSGRHGQPESAARLAFFVPTLVAVITIGNLLAARWNLLVWPRKTLSARDATVMWPLAIRLVPICVALFIVVQAFTLAAALGWISETAGLRGAGVVFSLGFAVIGNWLPLVTRPNPFVGYRLTVLYNDPERWRKAQRMAGYCFVAAGLLLALLFVIAPMLGNRLLLPVFAVAMLAPVLLTRRGAPHRSLGVLIAGLAAMTAPAGAQSATSTRAPLVARLDSLTRAWVANAPAAGVTVAVVKGSDTLLLEAVGERDRERHLPATTATVYRIGSITKQFTAAAIMQFVEQGRIALTDPVTKYLPEYPQWSRVTIRQLLNHTSGIHSYTSSDAWSKTWNDDLTPAQIVAFVANDTMDFASGTAWRYNNTGFVLLGMILDRVTGTPYPEYMRTHFFQPLGMQSAGYCPSHPADTTYAMGYDLRGTLVPTRYLSMTHPYSAGALCMSVPDYLTWQAALTAGRVVQPASFALMSSSDTLANGMPTHYGFGLAPSDVGSHHGVMHGGAVNGFKSEQSWFPSDSVRIVLFANTAGANTELLATNLAAATFGLPLATTPPPMVEFQELTSAERAKYVGIYDLVPPQGGSFPIHIVEEGGKLLAFAEGPGQGKFTLLYHGEDTFGAAFDPTLRITILFVNGKATRARISQRGMTMEGPRRQ